MTSKQKEFADRNKHIVSIYKKNGNASEVARQFRITRQRIWQILDREGIEGPRRKSTGSPVSPLQNT